MKIDDIILTDHAIARAEEIGITEEDAKKLLCSSQRQKDSWRRSAYKVFKYGDKQCDVEYYRKLGSGKYPPLLFTVTFKTDQQKWIIITITRRRKSK